MGLASHCSLHRDQADRSCSESHWNHLRSLLCSKSLRISLTLLLVLTVITVCSTHVSSHWLLRPRFQKGERKFGSSRQCCGGVGADWSVVQGAQYFWGRPSATSSIPNNAAASSGSNLGPLNPQLLSEVQSRIETLKLSGVAAERIPVDLVTASASGLDPHISPQSAEIQIVRVAKARGLPEEQVRSLVAQHTTSRQFGLLGEPAVNVLTLNLALDHSADLKK